MSDNERVPMAMVSSSRIEDSAAPRRVYLSCSRDDGEFAERLVNALAEQRVPTFWAERDISPGQAWADAIEREIASCACVLALLSKSYVTSGFALDELSLAFRRDRPMIPVLTEPREGWEIPFRLQRYQSIDLSSWRGEPYDLGFQRLVESIASALKVAPSAKDARLHKETLRAAELRSQSLFKRNLLVESAIEHVDIENTLFYRSLNWNLNPGINILLGRNGYGKTYLLRSLLALLQNHDNAAFNTLGDGRGSISLVQDGDERSIHFADYYFDEDNAVGKVPVLAIPDIRFVNRAVTTLSAISDETTGNEDRADLGSYGAWHFLEERPYESMLQSFLYGLCLDYFEHELSFEGEQFDLIRGVVRELTDQSFEFDRVAREGRDRFTLYVRTEGNEETPLPIQKASQGTLSIVTMFGLIYEFLKALRQETPEVCRRQGIVVIDELDAHLHPLWQQKVVSLLRSWFPRVQFVITAHNPIVVAGCLEDEVSVLRKRPEGGFSLYQFPNDFVGWQTEEICRKVFGIESPDENFARFDAMRPFKAQLEQQAAELAEKEERSPEEDRSLDEIEGKIRYIGRAEEVRSRRLSLEELERENRTLQDQVLGLESARQSAAEMQFRLDRANRAFEYCLHALDFLKRRTSESWKYAVVAIAIFVCGRLLLPSVLLVACLSLVIFLLTAWWLIRTLMEANQMRQDAVREAGGEALGHAPEDAKAARSK